MNARLFALVAVAVGATAQAGPLELTHQGRLLDVVGAPLESASTDLTFVLYIDGASSSPLWSETLSTALDGGHYTVVLGADDANALDPTWFEADLRLRIQTADGETLSDEWIRPVPTALSSYSLSGGPVDASELRVDGVAVRVVEGSPCSAATRGGTRFVPGSSGVADQLELCADDGSGVLEWRQLGEIVAGNGGDVNPPGTTLIASSAFTDPNPPAGWTQCAGFKNTSGDDVTEEALDGCLPVNRMRIRMWNANGVLVDDVYSEAGTGASSWPSWNYVTSNRTAVVATYWGSGAGFFATMDGRDACGQSTGGSTPHLGTGNGSVAGINPGHSNHSFELGRNCSGSAYLDFTVAVYR